MIALGLLTVAAVCHAAWNLLVKSSGQGPEFVWLYAVVVAPVSLVLLGWSVQSLAVVWWPALVSTLLHTAYAIVLQRAYGAGEFSIVYPISRGVTPALVTLATIPWAGWPSPGSWCGVAAVLCGVVLMDGTRTRDGMAFGTVLGSAVAACSCAYTLWDGFAIATLGAPVLPYLAVGNLAQVVMLSAVLAPRRRSLRPVLARWRRALPVAVLVPASYGLVLLAMSYEAVGTVATGRTLNVAVGTIMGIVILRERLTLAKACGLATVIGGVLLISA